MFVEAKNQKKHVATLFFYLMESRRTKEIFTGRWWCKIFLHVGGERVNKDAEEGKRINKKNVATLFFYGTEPIISFLEEESNNNIDIYE